MIYVDTKLFPIVILIMEENCVNDNKHKVPITTLWLIHQGVQGYFCHVYTVITCLSGLIYANYMLVFVGNFKNS